MIKFVEFEKRLYLVKFIISCIEVHESMALAVETLIIIFMESLF